MLTELLSDPKSPWWDDRSTKNVVEDRDMILRASLLAGYDRVVKKYGPPGAAWRWANSGTRTSIICCAFRRSRGSASRCNPDPAR